jgi:hypothetical protein
LVDVELVEKVMAGRPEDWLGHLDPGVIRKQSG